MYTRTRSLCYVDEGAKKSQLHIWFQGGETRVAISQRHNVNVFYRQLFFASTYLKRSSNQTLSFFTLVHCKHICHQESNYKIRYLFLRLFWTKLFVFGLEKKKWQTNKFFLNWWWRGDNSMCVLHVYINRKFCVRLKYHYRGTSS